MDSGRKRRARAALCAGAGDGGATGGDAEPPAPAPGAPGPGGGEPDDDEPPNAGGEDINSAGTPRDPLRLYYKYKSTLIACLKLKTVLNERKIYTELN